MINLSDDTYKKIIWGLLAGVAGSFVAGYNVNAYFDSRDGKVSLKKGEFLTLSELDKNYLSIKEVGKYYVLKSDLQSEFVSRQEYLKVTQERDVLKAQADELAKIKDADSKDMTAGETWTNAAPPFVVKFGSYGFGGSYVGAEVATHFVDSEASVYTIDKFNKPRNWTFTSKGQKYQVTATLKGKFDDPYLHVVWQKI